jgi:hypothetical protein
MLLNVPESFNGAVGAAQVCCCLIAVVGMMRLQATYKLAYLVMLCVDCYTTTHQASEEEACGRSKGEV